MKTTAGELAELLGADVPEGLSRALAIEDVTTDSRQVASGQVFIGLKGDKFDGTDYAATALGQGAALAVAGAIANIRRSAFRLSDSNQAPSCRGFSAERPVTQGSPKRHGRDTAPA